jgi:diguanylate cyclase (GGDEF)-like protein
MLHRPPPAAEAELPPRPGGRPVREVRRRGVLLATAGLLSLLLVVLVLALQGFLRLEMGTWLALLGVTLAVQGLLHLLVETGREGKLRWDPHFVYLPLLGFVLLFGIYSYAVPEIAVYALLSWPVALLFVVGFVGFASVAVLSALMALTYWVALVLSGEAVDWRLTAFAAFGFLVINLFSAVVHEKQRRLRVEMRAMRAALADQALTDSLTGLPNRRYLEEFLRGELERVRRYGQPCSVAMIDIDHFKNYNDTLGHVAGDGILQEVARQMTQQLRTADVLARYGGEEFALVMPSTPQEEAVVAVERMRQLLETHPFDREEVQPGGQLTVSAGVATAPEDGGDFAQVIDAADAAMYLAKRAGRNRVERTRTQSRSSQV